MEDFNRAWSSFMRLVSFTAFLCLVACDLHAAGTGNNFITPQTPNRGWTSFVQGTDSAGTYKTIYTGGTNGSLCKALIETNNDGSATHLVTVQLVIGAAKIGGTAVTTASNDGFANGVPPKNFMLSTIWPGLPLDSDGNPFIFLASADTLQATFATSLTASDQINLYAKCDDY
jgi:hypothetical protein